MALSSADKKEIETLARKEIKSFFESNTVRQYEEKFIEKLKKEITKGSMRRDVNEIVAKAFSEFYYSLWSRRTSWESDIKNTK
jgi:hypothetical protein